MLKLILIISILSFAVGDHTQLQKTVVDLFENFEIKNVMNKVVQDPELGNKVSQECFETLQDYANNFQSYSYELAMMALYSGRDLNDLGRFQDCNGLDFTRYIAFSVTGLPIGVFLGICGPVECTQDDYQPLRTQLVRLAKAIEEQIPDVGMLKVDWTEDNFLFVDSNKRNSEQIRPSPGFIICIIFFSFFII